MLHHTYFTMNLKPTCCLTSTCWYLRYHEATSMLVGHLCKLVGIKRYYTNHSLQATVTSRLFQPQRCVQLQKNLGWTKEALSNLLNQQPAGFSTAITPMQTPWSVPEQRMAAISTVLATHTSQLRLLNLLSSTFKNQLLHVFQQYWSRTSKEKEKSPSCRAWLWLRLVNSYS